MKQRAFAPGRVLAIAIAVALGFAAAPVFAASRPPNAEQSCSRLVGMSIRRSAIGLPTGGAVVKSATVVAADADGNPNGEYCAVKGIIRPVSQGAPNMEFQVNLPTEWNRKAVQYGGGGFDGTLVTGLGPTSLQPGDVPDPLRRGYVTLGSDGGHHQDKPGIDARFALNDEALVTYGHQSVKKLHDVAVAIIKARYGSAPGRFYFLGGSQGGHEALDAAARYADDYDGVVSDFPAYNLAYLFLGSWNYGKAVYDNGGAGWLSPAKTKLLTDAVYAACDGLDGLGDGIISDVLACNARFNVATVKTKLRCLGGTDAGDTCLSDAQIGAVERIASPYRAGFPIAGMNELPRAPILEGARFRIASTFGTRPVPSNPPGPGDAMHYAMGTAAIQYIFTRRPDLDALTFDPLAWKVRIQQVARITDVTDIDLTAFRKRGGKLILVHGTMDDFITPHNSIAYYDRQLRAQGAANLASFMRFYVVPGLSHGFAGAFNAKYDELGTLDHWVETGIAPQTVTASDGNPGAHRTRPMCRYPAWPRYNGTGSGDEAGSFTCTMPPSRAERH